MRSLPWLCAALNVIGATAFFLQSTRSRSGSTSVPPNMLGPRPPQIQQSQGCGRLTQLWESQDPSGELSANGKSPDKMLSPAPPLVPPPTLSDPANGKSVEANQQWKQEQYAKLKQIEIRLKEMQQKQLQEEESYKERIQSVLGDMGLKEKVLLEKVQFFANQLEEYRLISQQKVFNVQESAKKKDGKLREEIRQLRKRVNDVDWERIQCNEKSGKIRGERDALRKQVRLMRKQHAQEIIEWEKRYETEHNDLLSEQEKNRCLEEQSEAKTQERVMEERRKGQEVERRLCVKYEKELQGVEEQLLTLEAELKGKSEYLEQLEVERCSLRQLLSRSCHVLSTRAKKRLKPLLRKESKGFSTI